jgi:hypothetical protein
VTLIRNRRKKLKMRVKPPDQSASLIRKGRRRLLC